MVARLRALPVRIKIAIMVGLALFALAVTLALPPIPQPAAYHDLADRRSWLGLPHAANVLSNLAFLIVGGLGLAFLASGRAKQALPTPAHRLPYILLFLSLPLVAAGSAYYHYAPDNATLMWDRLPMAIAFMALLSGIVGDRIGGRAGLSLLPVLLFCGAASVLYWHFGELAGRGDLRFYGMVQFFPILAIPGICLLFSGPRTDARYILRLFLWYGVAKILETWDQAIFAALADGVSGHTLKHLAAATAAFMIVGMLHARSQRQET